MRDAKFPAMVVQNLSEDGQLCLVGYTDKRQRVPPVVWGESVIGSFKRPWWPLNRTTLSDYSLLRERAIQNDIEWKE